MEVAYYYFGGVDPEHQYYATYKTVFFIEKREWRTRQSYSAERVWIKRNTNGIIIPLITPAAETPYDFPFRMALTVGLLTPFESVADISDAI